MRRECSSTRRHSPPTRSKGARRGTRGEERTVAYLVEQLKKAGLQPGHPDGGWVQPVPLVGTTVKGAPAMTFKMGDAVRQLAWREDHVTWTKRVAEQVALRDSELVFVGYGVAAPEFSWDDFKGADTEGQDDGGAGRGSPGARPA